MNFIDKYSKYAFALAVIVIIFLLVTRPKPPIPTKEYQERALQLEKERTELVRRSDSIKALLNVSRAKIKELEKKDSVQIEQIENNNRIVTVIKKEHDKKLDAIDKFSSDDLKQRFAELKE
jgi:hypothetical protein